MGKLGTAAAKSYDGISRLWNLALAAVCIIVGVSMLMGAADVHGGARLIGIPLAGYGVWVLSTGVLGRS